MKAVAYREHFLCQCSKRSTNSLESVSSVLPHRSTATSSSSAQPFLTLMVSLALEGTFLFLFFLIIIIIDLFLQSACYIEHTVVYTYGGLM